MYVVKHISSNYLKTNLYKLKLLKQIILEFIVMNYNVKFTSLVLFFLQNYGLCTVLGLKVFFFSLWISKINNSITHFDHCESVWGTFIYYWMQLNSRWGGYKCSIFYMWKYVLQSWEHKVKSVKLVEKCRK